MSEGGPSAGAEKRVGVCLSNSAMVCRDPDSVAFGGVFRSQSLPSSHHAGGLSAAETMAPLSPLLWAAVASPKRKSGTRTAAKNGVG